MTLAKLRRAIRWWRRKVRHRRLRGKEAMVAMAENREAESRLWGRIARSRPPGADRDEARAKSAERSKEARRLREGEASLLRSMGLGGGP